MHSDVKMRIPKEDKALCEAALAHLDRVCIRKHSLRKSCGVPPTPGLAQSDNPRLFGKRKYPEYALHLNRQINSNVVFVSLTSVMRMDWEPQTGMFLSVCDQTVEQISLQQQKGIDDGAILQLPIEGHQCRFRPGIFALLRAAASGSDPVTVVLMAPGLLVRMLVSVAVLLTRSIGFPVFYEISDGLEDEVFISDNVIDPSPHSVMMFDDSKILSKNVYLVPLRTFTIPSARFDAQDVVHLGDTVPFLSPDHFLTSQLHAELSSVLSIWMPLRFQAHADKRSEDPICTVLKDYAVTYDVSSFVVHMVDALKASSTNAKRTTREVASVLAIFECKYCSHRHGSVVAIGNQFEVLCDRCGLVTLSCVRTDTF